MSVDGTFELPPVTVSQGIARGRSGEAEAILALPEDADLASNSLVKRADSLLY